jgi:hypothetical protein
MIELGLNKVLAGFKNESEFLKIVKSGWEGTTYVITENLSTESYTVILLNNEKLITFFKELIAKNMMKEEHMIGFFGGYETDK